MEKHELRAAASLAGVFSVRLLGLFMIYPVFASYALHLRGASAYRTGLALGIYGLTQGLLQIPFGLLSDRVGRKVMIVIGLVVFGVGSALAAASTSIEGVIIGRAVQGGGAIGSVILALVADLTSEESRTKAMALVGITIGTSFMVALVSGPLLAGIIGVQGIFWLMTLLALVGIGIVLFVVPRPLRQQIRGDAETVPAMLGSILRNPELLRLDFGIFSLHAMLTAAFLAVPALLHARLSVSSSSQWMVYLPILLVSALVMVPTVIIAERYRRMKAVFLATIAALAASQWMLAFAGAYVSVVLAALTLFFSAFNVMEATLPSLITKTSPARAKGTATGVYSSSQFLGIFVGGVAGGWLQQRTGDTAIFLWAGALALLWLLLAAGMRQPSYLVTRLLRVGRTADVQQLSAALARLPGVAEVVVVADEQLAYLKVDSKVFDGARAQSLADAGADGP
ncbi:MAG TPA: MFS transporter [Steroidobacteraceae bacterium]|nr:MFS transporter [Steroidobacteraceae bacterium]